MANRVMDQKDLKRKRRGRYARFTGATSKYLTRQGPIPFTEDEYGHTKTGKIKEVLVGEVSLTKQVISTGRGPDAERMASYYARLHTFMEDIPPTRGIHPGKREIVQRYQELLAAQKNMFITLTNNVTGRLDLFFKPGGNEWVFIDYDAKTGIFKRSRIYNKKESAMDRLKNNRITWVEHT